MSLKGLDEMGDMGLHFLHRARRGGDGWPSFKGTVSPDYKCLEVISIKSPLLGHVTPDI
jgi:hypothetical protein